MAYMDYIDLAVLCPQKDRQILSLTHSHSLVSYGLSIMGIWETVGACHPTPIIGPTILVPRALSYYFHLTLSIWHCLKLISQWQCSFHVKAALALAKRHVTASDHSSKTGPSHVVNPLQLI